MAVGWWLVAWLVYADPAGVQGGPEGVHRRDLPRRVQAGREGGREELSRRHTAGIMTVMTGLNRRSIAAVVARCVPGLTAL